MSMKQVLKRFFVAPAVLAIGLAAFMATVTAALAHHGWAGYGDEPFELTGIVEQVDLGQPHGHLMVRGDGVLWNVVLGPPSRNRRAGIDAGGIAIGDAVTAFGKRHRDPETHEMKTERLTVNGTVHDIYPERL